MDPLTTAVVTILGKYAVDKGAGLLKEAGQAAADAAGKLFQKVMERLKADPAEAKNAERFEKTPEAYQAPIADAVDEKVKSDPDFAAQLKALLEEFQKAAGTASTSIGDVGSGAVATQGSVAAGAGGVAFKVEGDVSGGIKIGKNDT